MAISTAKLREEVLALTDMKVDIMLNDEEFKSTYQIMEEISRVWKDIADVDQAALLELLGGKRQANILSSMLTNFETAQEALEKSANSAGSAMAENEKYLDSIGGKLKQLEAAWESLSATVLSSELVKGLLDLAIGFVQAIDKIISALGSIETAVGGMIAGVGIRSDILQVFKDIDAGASASTATVIGLKQAVRSLGNAVIAVIAIKVIDWLHDNIATANAARESYEELSDTLSGMHTNKDEIFELGARLEELKDKTELTTAEWEEYHDVQNRLHELLPELKGYYDSQQNWILTEIDSVESLAEAYRDLEQNKRRAMADEYTGGSGVTMQEEDRRKYNSAVDRQREAQWAVDLFEKKERQGFLSFTDSWNLMMSGFETIEEALHVVTQQQSYRDTYTSDARNQLANDALAYTVVGSMSDEIQNAFIEALGQFDFNTTQDYISKISKGDYSVWNDVYNSSAYQDIISGRLDDYDTARTSIIELGGLDQANTLLKEYEDNQQAINDGTYQWTDKLQKSHVAAIETYRAWLETQKTSSDTLNDTKPLSLEESQKGLIEDMNILEESVKALGEAYSEFAEGGEITASTLASLSETFGSCGDEWTDFVSLVGSGNMTLSDLDSALEDLLSKYVEQKALTGDVTEETKELLVEMLETIGITNAEEVAMNALGQSLAALEAEKIAAANPNFFNMSADEIVKLLQEEGASKEVAAQLYNLYLAKIQASDGGFLSITKEEVSALQALATAAGNASTALPVFNQLNAAIDEYNGLLEEQAMGGAITDAMIDEARGKMVSLQSELGKFGQVSNKTSDRVEADFNKITGAAEKTADKISDAFQEAYDELQFMREANLISEEQYLAQLFALNEKYNKNNLQMYRKYALEIFNTMKSLIADQINKQADAEIKALEEQREATEKYYDERIEALEKEREAKEKYYDELIEAEQDRLDQLKDEWTVQDHLLKIEQARAALKAAEQQKTVHLYKEGEGFVWEADQEEVGNANDALNEAIKDYERYMEEKEIQDRIDMLEDAKEQVLDMIDEQIEHLEEAKEQALEMIDEQIKAVEEWRDSALEALEDMEMSTEAFLEFFKQFGLEMTAEIDALIAKLDELAAAFARLAAARAAGYGDWEDDTEEPNSPNKGNPTGDDRTGDEKKRYELQSGDRVTTSEGKGTITREDIGHMWIDIEQPDGSIISKRYASGTLSVPTTGMALTDEEGPEIRIPGKGTFRKLHYGDAILPADVSRNLWMIGAKPVSFAQGIANMISNKTDDKRQNVFHFGDIHLPNVQNAQNFADEFKDIVMKATQLAYSK